MKLIALTLVLLLTASALATQASAQNLDQLSARLNALEIRLKKTSIAVKRQAARLARMQRRLDQQDDAQAPALASPDGRFGIGLTNEGVRLRGPGASVVLGASSLTLSSGAGGSALQLAPGRTTLSSPLINLGAGSSCPPVARRGDSIQLHGTVGSIIGSSTGVFAC
jgi:hypothetical protein